MFLNKSWHTFPDYCPIHPAQSNAEEEEEKAGLYFLRIKHYYPVPLFLTPRPLAPQSLAHQAVKAAGRNYL